MNRTVKARHRIAALGHQFAAGDISKWELYHGCLDEKRAGRLTYEQVARYAGIKESVLRDRLRYLQHLEKVGRGETPSED